MNDSEQQTFGIIGFTTLMMALWKLIHSKTEVKDMKIGEIKNTDGGVIQRVPVTEKDEELANLLPGEK